MAENKEQPGKDFKFLVRIANTDLNGNQTALYALSKVKGVGIMYANAILGVLKMSKTEKIGNFTDAQIETIEKALSVPANHGIPEWMMNRRSDPETGLNRHIVTNDLIQVTDNDIKMLKKIKSYKGVRHMFGLTVRGQKTRSNFRKNKGKVRLGVTRKKAPSAAPAKK